MATKRSGGRITGQIALTCEAAVALQVDDYVHLTGPYTVALADGTKPILGYVSVKNVKRTSTATSDTFPVGNPGGDVTVEARGFSVQPKISAGAIPAGEAVGMNGTGGLVVVAYGDVSQVGIALTAASAAGQVVDVLVR